MEIRKLTPDDRTAFFLLTDLIVSHLPKKEWLIPLTIEEAERVFQEDSMDTIIGVFIGRQLIATAGLFVDTSEFTNMPEGADTDPRDTREIGECLVHPSYRGAGLMVMLCRRLIDQARRTGVRTIFATSHPNNQPSQHSLANVGFKNLKTFSRRGFKRSFLRLDL